VDAALTVVAVEGAVVVVLLRKLSEPPQVLAEPLRRDGRVLPALVGVGLAGDEGVSIRSRRTWSWKYSSIRSK
jgi:hypothetical protein